MARSPEAVSRAKRKYLVRHPDRRKATLKKYYEQNRAKECARKRQWEKEYAEQVRAYRREYKRGNPMAIASVRRYQAKHPEKVLAYKANTRAKRKAIAGKLSPDLYARLLTAQQSRCAICHGRAVKFHLDHIVPIARGGLNEDANIQLLCRRCNQTKSARDPVEFMQSLGKLL